MINYLNVFLAVKAVCKNWLAIVLNKIFKIPIKFVVLRNGIKFKVNRFLGKADISMLAEIWKWEFYNPPFFEINSGEIVFDIGSNNGYFSIYAGYKNAVVFAFEPVPSLYRLIENNCKINNLNNISVFNVGISDKNEEVSFFVSQNHNGMHSMYKRSNDDEEIKIKTISLEKFCNDKNIEKIDLIKLDCEGAEYSIILSLSEIFLSRIKKISMEYHDDITSHNHVEIENFLRSNNFLVTTKNGFLYALKK